MRNPQALLHHPSRPARLRVEKQAEVHEHGEGVRDGEVVHHLREAELDVLRADDVACRGGEK